MKKDVLFLFELTLVTATNSLIAQGTAFNYQGQLSSNGSPATGYYDFTFALFDNNGTNTGQLGQTLTNLDVGVTNGLFNSALDFGAVFAGNATWLAISVRTNGGNSFTPLNPLQELLPVPYSIYAANAGSAESANSIAATNVTGTIPLAQLPSTIVTNNAIGVALSGAFNGDGTGLTSLTPGNLSSGTAGINITGNSATATSATTAATAVNFSGSLSGNVIGTQGATVVSSVGSAPLPAGQLTGIVPSSTLTGVNGSGLTSLSASQLTTGTIPLAQLPPAVVTNNEPSVTLGNVTVAGNLILPATTDAIYSGSTTILSDNQTIGNFFAGPPAGNLTMTGGLNTGLGLNALLYNTSGSDNTAAGVDALQFNTTGSNNTAIGFQALQDFQNGYLSSSGNDNTANGFQALYNIAGGSGNIAMGYRAGSSYAGNESSNIDIGNSGVTGENNIIRIGTPGVQTSAYIAGTVYTVGGLVIQNLTADPTKPATGQIWLRTDLP